LRSADGSGDGGDDGGGGDPALIRGLARRDSPRFSRRIRAGVADTGRGRAGKLLSEVDEEGVGSEGEEALMFV
jgi:hypothetical protein